MTIGRILMLGSLAMVAGCVAERAPPPVPTPERRPPPAAAPAPVSTPVPAPDWRDLPLSAGDWSYRAQPSPQAVFGGPAASFVLRCVPDQRQVELLVRIGLHADRMTVRTSFLSRTVPLAASSTPGMLAAGLAANDPLLDSIAFSRGRFTIEIPGAPMLVIPAWPEPARVIEDCRS